MRVLALLGLALATGCGSRGSADINADFDDADFSGRLTVFHGGRHIVIIDRPFECRDIGWIRRNYFSTERIATSRIAFSALQFTFEGVNAGIGPGTYSLEGSGSPATGWFLDNLAADESTEATQLQAERTRTSSLLVIESASDKEVQGNFEAFFGSGTALGEFRSVPCRNLRSN
jgi:hypothetical protein